jgi:hypothetical protein
MRLIDIYNQYAAYCSKDVWTPSYSPSPVLKGHIEHNRTYDECTASTCRRINHENIKVGTAFPKRKEIELLLSDCGYMKLVSGTAFSIWG